MTITFTDPAQIEPRFATMLYGRPGTGKTVGALSAPGPILYLNADRPHAASKARALFPNKDIREVTFPSEQPSEANPSPARRTLVDAYRYLRDEDAGQQVKSVVLDTVGAMYEKILKELSTFNTGKSAGLITLENYGEANKQIAGFVEQLLELPINVILCAHEQIDDAETQVTRRPMTGGKKLPEQLMGKMDIVAFTEVKQAEGQPPKYIGKLLDGDGYRAKGGPTFDLGDAPEIDLTKWIEHGYAALTSAAPAELQEVA